MTLSRHRPDRFTRGTSIRTQRSRHLLFLAHIGACLPFMLAWVLVRQARLETRPEVIGPLTTLCWVVAAYLLARAVLAWLDPPWLAWGYLFPVVDVLIISVAYRLRDDPDSVLLYAYFLPIAEAVGTLNVAWAGSIGLLSVVGAIAATSGQRAPISPLVAGYRLGFLVLMASLLTWMARIAAELRAELTVATERNRIALEMHDGLQGQLVTLASRLELVRSIAPVDGLQASQIASDCRSLARQAADGLRFLVHRLRAPELERGFLPALQQYLHHMGTRSDLAITLQVTGAAYSVSPEAEHALFRIVQESLNNTLKHANAHQVTVEIEFSQDAVRCAVRDDGAGFSALPASEAAGSHHGLEGMRARALQVGGDLRIESAPAAGTTVFATVPRPGRRGRKTAPAVDGE